MDLAPLVWALPNAEPPLPLAGVADIPVLPDPACRGSVLLSSFADTELPYHIENTADLLEGGDPVKAMRHPVRLDGRAGSAQDSLRSSQVEHLPVEQGEALPRN